MNNLKKFLTYAKKRTYASIIRRPIKIPNGGRKYIVKDKDYTYQDIFYGEQDFSGYEIVFFKNKPIWSMSYHGGVINEDIRQKCYNFLKSCLKKMPKDFPVRGPRSLKKGKWTYENSWKGDLENFSSEEKIFYEGKVVYSLKYIGGTLRDKQ